MEDRTIAGRYRLTERIGSGGMGVVWRAEDQRLRRIVAVKELLSRTGFDQESIDRAVREGRIAARLQHANVIALYDVVEHDGHPWLIMEYLPSRSLATVMTERGPLPPDEVARYGVQLASGLAAAHKAGVVHRDVKPGNVLVTEFGTVKVTDFGTSRAADEATVTASGMLVGTPAYLAPEVARGGKGEFPADVFAMGSTLYAALEGAPPFGQDGNTIALLHRVADGRFPPPRNAGPLTPVLMRLLDSNPETRPTMAEAAEMLRDVRFDGHPVPVPVPAPTPTPTAVMPAPVEPPQSTPAQSTPAQSAPAQSAPVQQPPTPPAPVDPVPAPSEERRGDRKALAALAIVALIATAVVVYLVNRGEGDNTTTAGPTTGSEASTQPANADPGTTQPTGTVPAEQPTTTAQPEPTTQTTTQPPAEIGADQALSDYYGLLPGNTEAAYSRLTDRFKANWSPTFADYQGWWGQMSAVSVSNVQAVGPDTVSATVSYTFKSGGTQSEQNVYTLVKVNGQWAIDRQNGN
ncbi:serine/threonine-protein kinase [Saccharothrix deserti]|uniref:serine/threonine-protein kinase n=1 Tax=Saccharothrix deserti TaxID=2593674 RepID=UPI00131D6415|nr:serine/threonine-protein kinase [Saccharothrix deserti]